MANGHGGARPGAGRPKGEPDERLRAFSQMCRDFLEFKAVDDEPRFLSAAKTLLRPIIEPKMNNRGEPIEGSEYLVNAASMLGALELVAGYGYGKPRQAVEIGAGSGSAIRFVVEAPPYETAPEWLARHAANREAADKILHTEDGEVN